MGAETAIGRRRRRERACLTTGDNFLFGGARGTLRRKLGERGPLPYTVSTAIIDKRHLIVNYSLPFTRLISLFYPCSILSHVSLWRLEEGEHL